MKILVVGEFSEGAAAYSYVRTLSKLGYKAYKFNLGPLCFSKWALPDYFLKTINSAIRNYFLKLKINKIKPDIVFIAKGERVYSKTLRWIKNNSKALIVNFYPDNPFTFWNGNSNANVLKSLPYYDRFLIWSKMLIPSIKSAGCKSVSYFPFVFDQDLFPDEIVITEKDKSKYDCDVTFVGTWEPDRERWLSELIKTMPDLKLSIWGNMWKENSNRLVCNLKSFIKGNAVYGDERLKLFRSAKIVLNFIRIQNSSSHNMRTMEVPASKAFLLTERTVEQCEELFNESQIASFSDVDELVNNIKYYLTHEVERQTMIKAANENVKKYQLDTSFRDLFKDLESLL